MTINPWIAEQLVASRRDEFERSAGLNRATRDGDPGLGSVASGNRSLRRLTRPLGSLFITIGRRLAGPEAWAEVVEARRLGLDHSSRAPSTLTSSC